MRCFQETADHTSRAGSICPHNNAIGHRVASPARQHRFTTHVSNTSGGARQLLIYVSLILLGRCRSIRRCSRPGTSNFQLYLDRSLYLSSRTQSATSCSERNLAHYRNIKPVQYIALATLTGLTAAFPSSIADYPSKTINRRSTAECSPFASATESPYVIQNNVWNAGAGTGQQCTTPGPVDGDTISWSTEWQWSGNEDQVKSYANVLYSLSNTQISQIKSIPTTWQWSYSTADISADVSYDMFAATTPNAAWNDHTYEFMVWLAAFGTAKPLAYNYGDGYAIPIESNVPIGGYEFNLTQGTSNGATVFSFLPSDHDTVITDFSGDVLDFIQYLVQNHGVPASQYLLSVQAGTEAFSGAGTFTTTGYSLSVEE